MASNGIAVISGSAGSVVVHKLLSDGVAVLGEDKAASVSVSGSLCVTGSVKISGSTQITGSALFLGDLIGNLTGNVFGDLAGDVTGNVLGNVTGDVLGDVVGDLTGNVLGNVVGTFTGSLSGALHSELGALGADDHSQYLNVSGRTGGQQITGGLNSGDELGLQANATDDGVIRVHSPFIFEDLAAGGNNAITFQGNFSTGGPFLGGFLSSTGTVTYNNSFFIWSLLADNKTYAAAAGPGFAAFTLFNALPTIQNSGNFDLVQALVLNAGVVHSRVSSGTSNTTQTIGVSFVPQTRATVSGATMRKTSGDIAVRCAPVFSTVAGSTADLGTTIGLQCVAPGVALFQPQAGTEIFDGYIGLDFAAMTHTTTGDKVVVRSAMTDAADRFFLQNNGGARSDFGGGNLLDCGIVQILADNSSLSLGAAGGDVQLNWNGSAFEWDFLSGDDLRLSAGTNSHTLQSANFGTASELRMGFDRFAFGQTSAVGNQVGIFVAPARSTSVAGVWSDFLFTQAANLTVNHAMSQVFGWTVNAPSMTIGGGGSVTDAGALLVGGNVNSGTNRYGLYILSNPSGGGGVNHSLRVAGSALFDDEVEIDGDLNHDGTNVGFYGTAPVAQSAAYTPSNVTTDRTYDANSTTIDEIADVLGTLIADLQATGLIG